VPIFEEIVSEESLNMREILFKKKQLGFANRLFLNLFEKNKEREKESVIPVSYEETLAKELISRIGQYTNSIEFVNLLQMPPDFYIETNVYKFHIWMLLNKLDSFAQDPEIGGRFAKIKKFLEKHFIKELKLVRYKFGLSKNSKTYLDVYKLWQTHQKLFEYHFQNKYKHDIEYKLKPFIADTILIGRIGSNLENLNRLCDYIVNIQKIFDKISPDEILKGTLPLTAMCLNNSLEKWEQQDLTKYYINEEEWVKKILENEVVFIFF
jgi:hypothetical protein